ncbi:Octaprenyl-diphosphate synthase [Poriferisphaera corsica]|uniref:Octaprenyl-diphosphate synthase n=2 Tax=Poriferisphaera corsica TaxID=2528020 RepID=A0A517YSX8_9BACT|nr:Octaprenyl-diphosphate synthase [Poriferisphaera corsica]
MLVLAQQDSLIIEQLGEDLADVEARFAEELRSDLECVNDLAAHIERYRGKMLRPTLVLVSALACPKEDGEAASTSDAHRIIATVAEMVHMATLVHDDILDDAEIRRRGKTINNLTTNETAVMLGDYLISHAYHLCSSLPDAELARMIAFATNTVCEGELYQLHNRGNFALSESAYFEIIRRKTASLCGMCCKLAGYINGVDEAVCETLYGYGEKLGIAFQIVDDVLDLTGDEQTVGKSLGRDLEKSKLTLPLIHYRETSSAEDAAKMVEVLKRLSNPELDVAEREKHVGQIAIDLREHASVEYARDVASKLIEEAKESIIACLPKSAAQELMLSMADAVLSRDF